jgi:hypothetical protein
MSFWVILALIALLFVIAMLVRNGAKKYTPAGLIWALLCLMGFGLAGFSGANSTTPSSAPRTTLTGAAANCIEHRRGRGSFTYSFVLTPTTGVPVRLETRIKAPICWQGGGTGSDAAEYRVVYLDDQDRDLRNEAIQVDVVHGQNAGWQGAVDSRPFGLWLGIPAGLALIVVGAIGMMKNRRMTEDTSSQVSNSHGPLKDNDSELTNLKL